MEMDRKNRMHLVWPATAACLLALNLAACDQKPSGEQSGKSFDSTTGQAPNKMDQAGDTAKKNVEQAADAAQDKAKQAGDMIREKTASAGDALADAALTAKVKSALVAESGVNALEIEVSTTNGIVTLNGTTNSQASRDKAAQIASKIEGVKSVRNELKIVAGS